MPVSDYTDEELRAVTPEQLANTTFKPGNYKTFTLRDPRNPGLISQVSPSGTQINPGVLGLRSQGVGMAGGILSDVRQRREEVIGDPSTFVERRTDPLRQQLNKQGENLTERLQKTGVTGEFGEQTQENFQVNAQQKLAQGEQLALDEFTALSNNLDQVEGGMLKLMENIDFNAFTQDLQARGLSQDLLNQLTRLEQGRIGIDNQQKLADRQELGNWISLFSQLVG